jgi:hypothetical protein
VYSIKLIRCSSAAAEGEGEAPQGASVAAAEGVAASAQRAASRRGTTSGSGRRGGGGSSVAARVRAEAAAAQREGGGGGGEEEEGEGVSYLHFVDLAGCERVARTGNSGARLRCAVQGRGGGRRGEEWRGEEWRGGGMRGRQGFRPERGGAWCTRRTPARGRDASGGVWSGEARGIHSANPAVRLRGEFVMGVVDWTRPAAFGPLRRGLRRLGLAHGRATSIRACLGSRSRSTRR